MSSQLPGRPRRAGSTSAMRGRGAAWTEERATQERATREGGASEGEGEAGGAPRRGGSSALDGRTWRASRGCLARRAAGPAPGPAPPAGGGLVPALDGLVRCDAPGLGRGRLAPQLTLAVADTYPRPGPVANPLAALAGLAGPGRVAPGAGAGAAARGVRTVAARLPDVLEILGLQAEPAPHGGRQRPGRARRYPQRAVQVLRRRVRLDGLGNAERQRVVDDLPALQIRPVHERHGDAGPPGPPGRLACSRAAACSRPARWGPARAVAARGGRGTRGVSLDGLSGAVADL